MCQPVNVDTRCEKVLRKNSRERRQDQRLLILPFPCPLILGISWIRHRSLGTLEEQLLEMNDCIPLGRALENIYVCSSSL